MQTYNIHEAKTHLSRLIELVLKGEQVVIAKSGKPLVKVVPIEAADVREKKRIGICPGEFHVPDDFDEMGSKEIAELFGVAAYPGSIKQV